VNRGHREDGAALIVGLILLMVLTILAISTMRTATLDLTMAGNTQFRENAFQLAESGIQATLRNVETSVVDLALVPDCPVAPQPWPAAVLRWGGAVAVPALSGRYETRVCFEGETVDTPGSSVGQFRQLHYRIESRGRTDQRNAEAVNAQGFYREVEG
jgi:type IV pilus assembly protein PilX